VTDRTHTSSGTGAGPILGQSRAVETLARAIAGGHLHHAWIFHGPFGVGKATTALAFAGLLLDPETTAEHVARFAPPTGTRVAQLIHARSHPDLQVITKERTEDSAIASLRDKKQTNIPVDLLRELMLGGVVDGRTFPSHVAQTSYLRRGKVYIIDEAELLDDVGQNALLKTLEEPPPGTYIVLVTTREDRLLPTIRSRCQRVAFGPLDESAMAAWIDDAVAAGTLVLPGKDDRRWLVGFAQGSPGTALLAAKYDVLAWRARLAKPVADLGKGRFPAGLADDFAEMVSACAEAVVKENPRASKEAANRLGVRLLFLVLGHGVREALHAAVQSDDLADAASWGDVADCLADADEQIRRHINMKHVLSLLVARWVATRERVRPVSQGAAR
jgi:DNA polymerase-3 subunit delta'